MVKPGCEEKFLEVMSQGTEFPGQSKYYLIHTGEREYVSVGIWESQDKLVEARPQMIGLLDQFRELLEEQPETGVTDPRSGPVVQEN